MLKPRLIAAVLSVGLIIPGTDVVRSQDYPSKPIRIATQAAGGGSDFMTRAIAQGISVPLGQPVIVENRGNAVLLGEFLSKAPPDGYGLVVCGGSLWIGPLLQKMPYDVMRDVSPITLLSTEASVLVVHPSVPVKSVKELIALAKAKPGALHYGSGASGGSTHLAVELFMSMAGVNIVRVHYKGGGPSVSGILAGEVQLTIDGAPLVPHIKSGRLRGLAVTSAGPSALVPGLPTVAASGLPGYESLGMTGIFAPAKTPATIITRLNQETVRLLNRADVKEKFFDAGVEIVGSSPEQFAATIKSEIVKWGKVIKDAGIKVD